MKYLKSKKDLKLYGKKYYFIPKNELLTLNEFYKLRSSGNFYNLSISDFDLIEKSKQKTFFCFGVRY